MKKYPLITIIAIVILASCYCLFGKRFFSVSAIPADRLTYESNGFSFHYPASFGGNVRRAVERPPKVTAVPKDQDAQSIGCPKLISSEITESWMGSYNWLKYTFAFSEDLWAGQRYSTFCYIFSWTTANYALDFEIHSHIWCGKGQCWAYCETPYEQECKDFDMEKQVLTTIEKIISTIKSNQ